MTSLHQLQQDFFKKPNAVRHILISHDYTDSSGRKRYKYTIERSSHQGVELIDYQRGCCLYLNTTLTKDLPFPQLHQRMGEHVIYPTIWFDSGESCGRFVKTWCLTHGLEVEMDYTYPTPKRMGRFPLIGPAISYTGQPLDHVYHHPEDSLDPICLLVQGDLEPWFIQQRKWTKVVRISPTRWSVTAPPAIVTIEAEGWVLIESQCGRERVRANYVLRMNRPDFIFRDIL